MNKRILKSKNSRINQALSRISHQLAWRGGEDANLTRLAIEATAVVLDSTARRPTEHNAVRLDVFAAAVVSW